MNRFTLTQKEKILFLWKKAFLMYHGISGSSLLTFQEVNAWSLTVGVVLKKRLSKSSLWILDYTFTFIVYLLVGFTTDLIPPFLPGLTRNCIS